MASYRSSKQRFQTVKPARWDSFFYFTTLAEWSTSVVLCDKITSAKNILHSLKILQITFYWVKDLKFLPTLKFGWIKCIHDFVQGNQNNTNFNRRTFGLQGLCTDTPCIFSHKQFVIIMLCLLSAKINFRHDKFKPKPKLKTTHAPLVFFSQIKTHVHGPLKKFCHHFTVSVSGCTSNFLPIFVCVYH